MMEYNFTKDEFSYFSTALVFGLRSPKIKDFKHFSFPTFRKHNAILFKESQQLNTENHLDIHRKLIINDKKMFMTSKAKMSSGINQIISFIDNEHKIQESDSLFTDSEFEYFKMDWNELVANKIRTMGNLIRSVIKGELYDVPVVVAQFSNITKVLVSHPEYWLSINERKKFRI